MRGLKNQDNQNKIRGSRYENNNTDNKNKKRMFRLGRCVKSSIVKKSPYHIQKAYIIFSQLNPSEPISQRRAEESGEPFSQAKQGP